MITFAAYCKNRHCAGYLHPPQRTSMAGEERYQELLTLERAFKPFCSACGCPVHERCEGCNARFVRDAGYCRECGTAAPWTAAALEAAAEAVAAADLLSASEKGALIATFPDIAAETPRTTLAVLRFKQLATKAGPAIGPALIKLMVDVAMGEAKKHLGF